MLWSSYGSHTGVFGGSNSWCNEYFVVGIGQRKDSASLPADAATAQPLRNMGRYVDSDGSVGVGGRRRSLDLPEHAKVVVGGELAGLVRLVEALGIVCQVVKKAVDDAAGAITVHAVGLRCPMSRLHRPCSSTSSMLMTPESFSATDPRHPRMNSPP